MLSKGMYVSCPIIKNEITVYVLGKVERYDKTAKEVDVVFYDGKSQNSYLKLFDGFKKKYFDFDIKRASAACSSTALWGAFDVYIICELGEDRNHFIKYVCKYKKGNKVYLKIIPESELYIDFYNIKNNARDEAVRFINADAELFFSRQTLSKRRAFMDCFEEILFSLINTRIFLYPHQIDTVVKATRGGSTRVMLADEVGLGKTIEALTILKYYMQNNPHLRCIIVVPEALLYQWFNELNDRFKIDAEVFSYTRIKYKKTKAKIFVISYGEYHKYKYDIEEMKWDMLIIDEAHKLLNGPYYSTILSASVKIRNVIMLSATPITNEGMEYLRLMRLINPNRYRGVSVEQFGEMIELQKKVSSSLVDMNTDINLYNKIDMKDSFITNLEELNEELGDNYLKSIILSIEKKSDDNGLYAVKLAMEYLRQKYVVESNIIRHRREDIKATQIKRNLIGIYTYQMRGADLEIFESDMYESFLPLAGKYIDKRNKKKWIKAIEAMHSSPYALLHYLLELDIPNTNKTICLNTLKKWKMFCDKEIEYLISGSANNNTRFGCLIEAIEASNTNKIVIFSVFKETTKVLYHLIQRRYGKDCSVMLNSEMSRLEVQLAARKFHNSKKCRFIICDESGGEGRNFQNADLIIHFDMPWSPAIMEQRIGRLDRIGRNINQDVDSMAIYAEDTVEEKIFDIHNNMLEVFSRCLSGLEIIFDKLQERIEDAFVEDPLDGLQYIEQYVTDLKERMANELANEIYFSACNESDANGLKFYNMVSNAFEDKREKEVEDRILVWLNKSGLHGVREEKTDLVNISFKKSKANILRVNQFYEAFSMPEYTGTFRRRIAMSDEAIEYFSPNHYLYKTIMKQLDRNQRNRFLAISVTEEVHWAGFLFVWNIELNQMQLLIGGLNPEKYRFLKKYLEQQQIINTYRVYGTDDMNEDELLSMIKKEEIKLINGLENTVAYDVAYNEDSWEDYINNVLAGAYKRAKAVIDSRLKDKDLRSLLNKDRINLEIARKTVCFPYEKRINSEKAMESSIFQCTPEIDAILYIEV